MAVTQTDLARKLGLNQKTVSIAFGARGRIGATTRERVLSLASQLGYRPNHLAAGLRGGATRSIGLIWAFVDPWAGDATIGLDVLQRLQGDGFATYQAQHNERVDVLCRQLDDFLNRRVDAIVIQAIPSQLRDPDVLDRLRAAPAVVAVTREPVADFVGDLVVHDRSEAIRQVVDHFAHTGRRRPAFLLSMNQESNPPKYAVFAEHCRRLGIAHEDMLIELDFPSKAETHGQLHLDGFRRRWPKQVGVDAVFCFNDIGALYVMRELQDRDIRVPENVAVVGFNNTEPGQLWRPALASGDRRHDDVAEAVVRLLDARLADPQRQFQTESITMQFIRRQSAG